MMTVNKNDILKTVMILWFILATGYVAYDQYLGYKVRGMQAAYNQGYSDSVTQLINESQKGCDAIDVHNGDKKVNVVNAECLKQLQQQPQQAPQQAPKK